jgi:flagellar protein FliO/FliZ
MKLHHNLIALIILAVFSLAPRLVLAADVVPVTQTGGVFKMVLGLAVVLAVMALITWGLKRMVPGVGHKQSVIRIVGGVSVGSRERVVVLEVAGRWILVGVAAGQVSRLANLEAGSAKLIETDPIDRGTLDTSSEGFTKTFAAWLTQSTGKILEKKDIEQ